MFVKNKTALLIIEIFLKISQLNNNNLSEPRGENYYSETPIPVTIIYPSLPKQVYNYLDKLNLRHSVSFWVKYHIIMCAAPRRPDIRRQIACKTIGLVSGMEFRCVKYKPASNYAETLPNTIV